MFILTKYFLMKVIAVSFIKFDLKSKSEPVLLVVLVFSRYISSPLDIQYSHTLRINNFVMDIGLINMHGYLWDFFYKKKYILDKKKQWKNVCVVFEKENWKNSFFYILEILSNKPILYLITWRFNKVNLAGGIM